MHCHAKDASEVEKVVAVAGTFSDRHHPDDDFEVIPIPDHTAGATAYLWTNGEDRCLFTGDSLYLRNGEWRAAVLPSSDREAYVESLELLRDLDFNLLELWAASLDGPFCMRTDRAHARRRINPLLNRVRSSADG